MPKVIDSPVKRWPGKVTISDPLSYPQVLKWRQALRDMDALEDKSDAFTINFALLPGILACVEGWELENFPPAPILDTFPATPPMDSMKLLTALVTAIGGLFSEAEEIPLA